jgi:DNA-binding transcriptional regulator YdaS (Cro superfamily)
MERLREFLNSMTMVEQAAFAKKCKTSIGYLRKAIGINQALRPALCVQIEIQSGGKVTRRMLRKDWRDIWPELVYLIRKAA